MLFDTSCLLVALMNKCLLLSVRVNNLSQNQIDGKEGTEDYQQAKEYVGREGIVARVGIVVHHNSPTFQCAHLKGRQHGLTKVIKSRHTKVYSLIVYDIIILLWVKSCLFEDVAADGIWIIWHVLTAIFI